MSFGWDSAAKYGGGFFNPGPVRFVDGDHTGAVPVGPPKITFPFEGDSHAPTVQSAVLVAATNPTGFKYQLQDPDPNQSNSNESNFILEQRFRVAAQWFQPLALDTPYDLSFYNDYQGNLDLAQLILVSESTTTEVEGGFLEWVRTYATIPFGRNEYEAFTFTFPGIDPGIVGDNSEIGYSGITNLQQLYSGSQPITADILARVEHRYFLVSGGVAPGPFSPEYRDPTSLFFIHPTFKPFYITRFNFKDFVFDNDFVSLLDFTDIKDGSVVSPPMLNTIPPKTDQPDNTPDSGVTYTAMVQNSNEICVKSSVIRRWRGNIFEKITYWSCAQ